MQMHRPFIVKQHFCCVRSLLFILFFLVFTLSGKSQEETPPPKPEAKPLSNVVFQFDNRRENYYGVKGRTNGLKLGLEFYKFARVGVGFYSNNRFYPYNYPDRPTNLNQTISLRYTALFTEIVAFRGFRHEISFPVSYGKGFAEVNKFSLESTSPTFIGTDTISNIQLLDIGINAHYKPIPFFGVGFGFGYRANINNVPNLKEPLSRAYFDFKLKLFIGYVYKAVFKPKSIKEERAYYKYRKEQRQKKRQNR